MGSGVPYKTLQKLVVGRENETTIEKGIGNGAPVFGFLVCFFHFVFLQEAHFR